MAPGIPQQGAKVPLGGAKLECPLKCQNILFINLEYLTFQGHRMGMWIGGALGYLMAVLESILY